MPPQAVQADITIVDFDGMRHLNIFKKSPFNCLFQFSDCFDVSLCIMLFI